MPNAESRHIDSRTFRGEGYGARVAEYLNHGSEGGRQRIISLLLQLLELAQHGRTIPAPLESAGKELAAYLQRAAVINRQLARYKTSPMLWARKDRSLPIPFLKLEHMPSSKRKADFLECLAACDLIQLAGMNLLRSLTQCEGKHSDHRTWFFARFAHQRFCSDACRIRYNASSPEAKRYRAEKAREYYVFNKRQLQRKRKKP